MCWLEESKRVDATEAVRVGLVNEVVPKGKLITRAIEIANEIKKSAPLAARYTKQLLRRGLFDADMKRLVGETSCICRNSEDAEEARHAFKERREPVFKGR